MARSTQIMGRPKPFHGAPRAMRPPALHRNQGVCHTPLQSYSMCCRRTHIGNRARKPLDRCARKVEEQPLASFAHKRRYAAGTRLGPTDQPPTRALRSARAPPTCATNTSPKDNGEQAPRTALRWRVADRAPSEPKDSKELPGPPRRPIGSGGGATGEANPPGHRTSAASKRVYRDLRNLSTKRRQGGTMHQTDGMGGPAVRVPGRRPPSVAIAVPAAWVPPR